MSARNRVEAKKRHPVSLTASQRGTLKMGKIHITVDAGNQRTLKFEWSGDDHDIAGIVRRIEDIAEREGVTPNQLTHSFMRFMAGGKMLEEGARRELLLVAITYFVLALPTNNPEMPGTISNYAAGDNIRAVLHLRDNGLDAEIEAGGFSYAIH